jgi:hypothetical protein
MIRIQQRWRAVMKRILTLSRFLETSAKTNINVEQAFVQLAESILEKTNVQAACHTLPLHSSVC